MAHRFYQKEPGNKCFLIQEGDGARIYINKIWESGSAGCIDSEVQKRSHSSSCGLSKGQMLQADLDLSCWSKATHKVLGGPWQRRSQQIPVLVPLKVQQNLPQYFAEHLTPTHPGRKDKSYENPIEFTLSSLQTSCPYSRIYFKCISSKISWLAPFYPHQNWPLLPLCPIALCNNCYHGS